MHLVHRRRAEHADLLDESVCRFADRQRMRLAEAVGSGKRFPRGRRHRAAVVFDDDEDHFSTPISVEHVDDGWRSVRTGCRGSPLR